MQRCDCSEIYVRKAKIIKGKTLWSMGKLANYRKILKHKDEFCVLAGDWLKHIAEARNWIGQCIRDKQKNCEVNIFLSRSSVDQQSSLEMTSKFWRPTQNKIVHLYSGKLFSFVPGATKTHYGEISHIGIEPTTFRFVAQHLNHYATAVPYNKITSSNNICNKCF